MLLRLRTQLPILFGVTCSCLDPDGLRSQALKGFQMGFTGKQVIHPDQLPIVHDAFSPSQEKIQWARLLMEAHESNSQVIFSLCKRLACE